MDEPDLATPSPGGRERSVAATLVLLLAVLGTMGSAVMTLAHLGWYLPGLDLLGPGRLVVPAAIGFGVGTALYAVVVFAVARRTSWAWWAALAVNGLAFVTAVTPLRNWVSVVAASVAACSVVVLLTRPGRDALRH